MALSDDDLLARHALEKSHYRANGTVKPNAFRPMFNRETSTLETSTFKVTGLDCAAIAEIGNRRVAGPQGRELKGWSGISVQSVTDCGLNLDPDNEPECHVGIIGWPEERPKQLEIQLALSNKAEFVFV